MRILFWLLCVALLAISGFGVHLVCEQQRKIAPFSARTTAIVLEKRLERHVRQYDVFTYEPVVKFRFQAYGQEFTSDSVFPDFVRVGGSLGRLMAQPPLDRFQIGEETTAYYNPKNPAQACLIRRPVVLFYLVVLLPVIAVSGLVAFLWRSPEPGDIEFERRKGRWIAALWHVVGLAATGHYFGLAGADYGEDALVLFCVYTQLGMIPVAFALPPSKSSPFARRLKRLIGYSLFGTFFGIGLGLFVLVWAGIFFSVSATFGLQCMRYAITISVVLCFLIGLLPEGKKKVQTE